MGMFDMIICKAPIEGGLPVWIHRHGFQTKSLDCEMETYTIAEDGTFSQANFSGTVNFYTSNVVGSGPGIYTEHGEDAEYIDCMATFLHGKLVEPIKVERKFAPAWPSSRHSLELYPPAKRTDGEQAQRYAESMAGKRIYVLWGGRDVGYWAKVVYQSNRLLCVAHEAKQEYHDAGDLELIDRRERDRIFWDSEEEALYNHHFRQSTWDAEAKAFREYEAEWHTRRK